MFKKIVSVFVAVVSALSVSVPVSAAPVGEYTRAGYIEDVDLETGLVVLVDECNQVWWWDEVTFQTPEGPELLRSGYKVVIQIDGRGTRRRKDDVVIDFEVYDR